MAMRLSEHDRRVLAALELALVDTDPGFVAKFEHPAVAGHAPVALPQPPSSLAPRRGIRGVFRPIRDRLWPPELPEQ